MSVNPKHLKTLIAYALGVALLAVLLLAAPREGSTTFRIATDSDFVHLPSVHLSTTTTGWVCVGVLAALFAAALALALRDRATPMWLHAVVAVVFLVGFLGWAGAGETIPVVGLFGGAIAIAAPLIFGALGGVIGERAGVVNIAIEGQLLFGAFGAALVGSLTDSPWLGLLTSMLCGTIVALLLGLFAITHVVEQVIVGVVLNVLIIGITSFLYSVLMGEDPQKYNATERFPVWAIPLLGDIPVIGPILFRQRPIIYLMYVVVVLVTLALYRTRWGLRLRAVGEHPQAADTVGIKVALVRYRAILIGGAIAGMGGAYYTLAAVSQFTREMTGGAGYIALAAVIFGRWDPVRATLAALLFGFASTLQTILSTIGSPVPSQFMLMLPYVVTLVAVAGLVGRSRAPAADGVPYVKG